MSFLYYQTLLTSQIRLCYSYFLLATLLVLYFGSMSFGHSCWWLVNRLFLQAVSTHRNTMTMTPIPTGQNHASITAHISESASANIFIPRTWWRTLLNGWRTSMIMQGDLDSSHKNISVESQHNTLLMCKRTKIVNWLCLYVLIRE